MPLFQAACPFSLLPFHLKESIQVAKIIVVTSGKGGVGKTTTSASIATGLALQGHKTCVIDFDVGLRNLDLIMGCERRVVYDLVNVIQCEATAIQALIKDKHCENLFILPASQTRDTDALTKEGVGKVLKELVTNLNFEFVVCDSPAGIETGALMALYFADEAIITTNPEVSSVRDSDRILGILQSKSRKAERGEAVKEHLLITRYSPERGRACYPSKRCRCRAGVSRCGGALAGRKPRNSFLGSREKRLFQEIVWGVSHVVD